MGLLPGLDSSKLRGPVADPGLEKRARHLWTTWQHFAFHAAAAARRLSRAEVMLTRAAHFSAWAMMEASLMAAPRDQSMPWSPTCCMTLTLAEEGTPTPRSRKRSR